VNTVCVLVTTSILLFPGCLLRKDGTSDLTKDGIRISVAVAPDSLQEDSVLTVTLTVENTSAESRVRAFPIGAEGEPMVSMHHFTPSFDTSEGFFGNNDNQHAPDTLRLAPHAKTSGVWHYRVYQAGTTWVVACFPENNGASVPGVCASREVTLKTK
jgi:hypothetical protein